MRLRGSSRPLIALLTLTLLAVLLSGCVGIKPGTYKLSQPAGIGPVNLRLTVCTLTVGPPPPESEIPSILCGPPNPSGQGQILATLVVPTGTVAPPSFNAVPGAGAGATTFTRNAELTAAMNATEFRQGSIGPPPGFEVVGYTSGTISETSSQEYTWTLEAGLGLPPGPGGGSFGGPLRVTAVIGWRGVSPEFPASRPINCKEGESEGETFCGAAEPNGEATLGVSDLKINPPATTTVLPGTRSKVPFVLDFASSATQLPSFKLALASKLPGAEVSLSNSTFSRGPSEPATGRAPATTRNAIVQVPANARLGSYELTLNATANQGGATGATTTLVVKPKGTARLTVPKRVRARRAWTAGIPVRLLAPIVGTRFVVTLKGPRPSGKGSVRMLRRLRVAPGAGPIDLRLRIPRPRAEKLLAEEAALKVEARVRQPGKNRPQRLVRILKLR